MFTLRVKTDFAAAHFLEGYPYECKRLHGHNFVVEVFVKGHNLDKLGMLIDFKVLKSIVRDEISRFDHELLNELPDFKGINPTSENISRVLFTNIKRRLSNINHDCELMRVRVWENENGYVDYEE